MNATVEQAEGDDIVTIGDHAFGVKTHVVPGSEHARDRGVEGVGAPPGTLLDCVVRIHPLGVFGQQLRANSPLAEQLLEDPAQAIHVVLRHGPPSIRSWRLLGLVLFAGAGQRLVSRPVLNAPLELVHRRRCCPTGMPNDPYDLPNASALTAIGRRPAGRGQALGVSTAALADHVCDSWHRRQIRLFPETVDPSKERMVAGEPPKLRIPPGGSLEKTAKRKRPQMTADGNGGGDLDPKAVEELRRVARSRPKSGREGGREGERAADVGEIQPGEASGAADDLRFEYAAKLRDEIKSLRHELAEVEASA